MNMTTVREYEGVINIAHDADMSPTKHYKKELKCSIIEEGVGGCSNTSSFVDGTAVKGKGKAIASTYRANEHERLQVGS
jgi:hypothetical protein